MFQRAVEDSLQGVDPAVNWANDLAAEAGLPDSVCFALQVALEEGLANLVAHGDAGGGSKAILVTFEAAPPSAVVTISDACAPFDVTQASTTDLEMDELPLGGLGLRLLRSFAQDMTYERVADRNVLTMVFKPS